MVKTVKIGNKTVKLKASAATPRLYRNLLNRDVFLDYAKLISGEGGFNGEQTEILENLAFVMAKQADDKLPDDVGEWLDSLDGALSVFNIFSDILELWNGNTKTTSEAKKKVNRP